MGNKKNSKNVHKLIVGIITVMVLIVISLSGVIVLQSKKAVLEKSIGEFKILSVREVFENTFKDVSIQIGLLSNPKITGIDEMKNVFTLEIQKDGKVKFFVNDALVEKPEEQYAVIYQKALFNILRSSAPEDYKTSRPELLFEYIRDYSYEYVSTNGKEFITVKGKNDLDNIEMWFLFRRINNKVKVFVDKVILNGVELSDVKKTALLSNIYQVEKKVVKANLIDIVKSNKLFDFPEVDLTSVFDNLKNGRWSIKDEDRNLVEYSAVNEVNNMEESLVIGFKLREDGYVDLEYVYLNGQELSKADAYNKIRDIYKRFGKFDEARYVQNLIEQIKTSKIAGMDKTIGEFFEDQKNLYNTNWTYSFDGKDVEIVLKGNQKSGDLNFELYFKASGNEIYLIKSFLNKGEISPDKLFSTLKEPQTVESKNTKYIDLVKNASIVSNSQFKDNASAFQSFLKNPVWSYNEKTNRVVLTGNGKYGSKNWDFKFVFEIPVANRVLLEYAYANNVEMIDDVRDYVVSKIFKISEIGDSLAILVKNTVFKRKTYGEILGEKNWSVDRVSDLVIYNNGKLRIAFFVEPNGDVKITDFYYNGKRYSKEIVELLTLAEEGNGVYSIQNALEQNKTEPAKEPIKEPVKEETKEEKEDENVIPYQF